MKEFRLRDVIALLVGVVFAIVVIAAGCDARPKAKRPGYRTECVYNLKGLYMDYGVFVEDHGVSLRKFQRMQEALANTGTTPRRHICTFRPSPYLVARFIL